MDTRKENHRVKERRMDSTKEKGLQTQEWKQPTAQGRKHTTVIFGQFKEDPNAYMDPNATMNKGLMFNMKEEKLTMKQQCELGENNEKQKLKCAEEN